MVQYENTTQGQACLLGGQPEHRGSAGLFLNRPIFFFPLARSDLLPEPGVNINQRDTVHCLCAKHLRLLPLKITCSLILSLSRPDHSYPLPRGW